MDGDKPVVALVDVSDPGVTLLESGSSARITTHTVVLDGAAAELLGHGRRAAARRALRRRPLPHRRRRRGRRPRPDRRLHQGPHPVRPLARGVPGGRDADRGRLHRLAHPRPRGRERRLAARPGPRRQRRPRGGGVLDLHGGARRRCAPATTCTAAWASTRPTRCTTTSAGSPTSPTRSTCAPRRSRSRTRPPRTSS